MSTELIIFDRRVVVFLGILFCLFLLITCCSVHGSSIHCWLSWLPDSQVDPNSLLLGKPQKIRSDEWGTYTPYLLSQCAHGFPLKNESIGSGYAPFFSSVPIAHYSTFFRPQYWAFFFLNTEHAFSVFWSYKTLGLLVTSFLLFLLLTRNRFWLSLFAAFWVFLSSFIQWWFSIPFLPGMIATANIITISFIYLVFSTRKTVIILAVISLSIFSVDFALYLYPQFLVPTFYFSVFLALGFCLSRFSKPVVLQHLTLRITAGTLSLVVILTVLILLRNEVQETLTIVSNTLHPGVRIFCDGGMNPVRFFWGFFSPFLTSGQFPHINVCESAGFLLFFPLLIFDILIGALINRNIDYLELALIIFIVLLSIWLIWGLPPTIAAVTLLDKVHARGMVGVGLGSIALTIVYLARPCPRRNERTVSIIVFVTVYFIMLAYGHHLGTVSDFFTLQRTLIVAVVVAVASTLLLRRQVLLFSLTIVSVLLPNILVNPVARGLSPITGQVMSRSLRQLAQQDPEARWIVLNNSGLPGFLKASGIRVVNGKIFPPNLELMRRFDPQRRYEQVYNRAAFIDVVPVKDGNAVPRFEMGDNHFSYHLYLDPCDPRLPEADIRYLVFTRRGKHWQQWSSCLTRLETLGNMTVCKITPANGVAAADGNENPGPGEEPGVR